MKAKFRFEIGKFIIVHVDSENILSDWLVSVNIEAIFRLSISFHVEISCDLACDLHDDA